jgi:hypothetical protein
VGEAVAEELGRRCEASGYSSLWTTDVPNADGLAEVAGFARGSKSLRVGIGVLALDRNRVESIAQRVVALKLPQERLLLGIGSGASGRPLKVVSDALKKLRELLPNVELIVGAMGPKMCALGGQHADGVLLNWLTPSAIPAWRTRVGGATVVRMYVRAVLEPDGRRLIARQVELYKSFGMKRHFEEVGTAPGEMGVTGRTPDDFNRHLEPYEAILDEAIVRALPASKQPDDLFAIVTAAAPRSRES